MKRDFEEREAERFTIERLGESTLTDDIVAIEALAREAFEGSGLAVHEELARPWSRLWVARPQGSAQAMGVLLCWHVADELHVLNVATLPSMRRRGVARALMDEALRYARAQHIRIVLLEVRRSNRAAIKLYRGLSFSALGVRAGYYADNGEDAVEMILGLDPVTGAVMRALDEIPIDG